MNFPAVILGCLFSGLSIAGTTPGDINIHLTANSSGHPYKFRILINQNEVTLSTECITAYQEGVPTITYGAIGTPVAHLTVQTTECDILPEQWVTLAGSLGYNSNYWYDLFVDMNEKSFHL